MSKNLTHKLADWQGDLVMPAAWSGMYGSDELADLVEYTRMSTAIFRTYTSQGFVIAADGLRRKTDGSIVRTDVQKIFPIEGENKSIA